nr:MAG TPA: hypothetical protein [Caudoviricetes sp.]
MVAYSLHCCEIGKRNSLGLVDMKSETPIAYCSVTRKGPDG